MKKRRWLMLAGTVVALVALAGLAAACGDDDDDGNGDTGQTDSEDGPTDGEETTADGEGTRLEISAEDSLSFSTGSLAAPAGQSFTVVFDNQDDVEPHNFAIYTDDSASELIDGTAIETGPIKQELAVGGLEAGEYFFKCDVHPTTMTGTLTVQ